MRNTFILLLYLCVVCGCNSIAKVSLKDISRDTIISLTSRSSNPTTILLKIHGAANDTFMIQDFQKIPGGEVDSSFKLDCYTKEFSLRYKAYKASKGHLIIEYRIP